MSKVPFEKIRSKIERDKILQKTVTEASELTLKGREEELYQYKPVAFQNGRLILQSEASALKEGSHEVLGNFAFGEDRYFLKSKADAKSNNLVLANDCDVFKLERRKTARVAIPDDMPVRVTFTQNNGKPFLHEGAVVDVSGGGFKFFFKDTNLVHPKNGDRLTGTVYLENGKTLPFVAELRHSQVQAEKIHYGVQVDDQALKASHRFLAMAMDLQHKIVTSYKED